MLNKFIFILVMCFGITCYSQKRNSIAHGIEIEIPDSLKLNFKNAYTICDSKLMRNGCICYEVEETPLDTIAALILKFTDRIVSISFHTDQRGSAENNLRLSKETARKYKSYLLNWYNIDSTTLEQIEFDGYGEANPIFEEEFIRKKERSKQEMEKLFARNSRIEIVFK